MKMHATSILATLAIVSLAPLAHAAEQVVTVEGTQHPIPVTVTMPEGEGPFPFVVMFHGTGSNRHEAGGGYDLLAPELAEAGIASARFDFAGNGDSSVDYIEYTLTGGMQDGLDVVAYMRGLDAIDDDRLGMMGWSQGGTIAMLAASRTSGISSLVTWNGALDMSGIANERYEEAKEKGFIVLEFDWRSPLNLSFEWIEEARNIDIAQELAGYDGALLAINGENDEVVDPAVADAIVAAAVNAHPTGREVIPGADHIFNIFSGDMSAFDKLVEVTVDWFEETL